MTSTKTTTKTNHYFGALVALTALAMMVAVLLAGGTALAATTLFSKLSPIQILDNSPANPYPSQMSVQNLNGNITDVNVNLFGYSHTFPDDVGVLLVGPQGQKSLLMSDVGFSNDVNNVNLTLDDEATNSLPDLSQISTGVYKPTEGTSPGDPGFPLPPIFPSPAPAGPYATNLSVFDNTDPNGTWDLYVIDDGATDVGQFAGGWSLKITTDGPDPQPDTTSPKVKSTTPNAGATGVLPTANVNAVFSEDMKTSTLNGTTFKLFRQGSTTKVSATVRYDVTADQATLDPTNSLKRGTTYKAVVTTDAKDLAGNSLDQNAALSGLQQKVWTFKVRT